MLRRLVFRPLSVIAAVGLIACGTVAGASATPTALNAQDRAYLQGAHQSNLAEIATGKLAQSKGSSEAVKELGALLVRDHTKLDAAVRKVAAAKKVSLPAAPNAEQRALQAKLAAAPAGEFDALFVAGQIASHAKTMQLGKKELQAGQDPTVKKNAAAAAPVVAEHHHKFMAQAEAMGMPGAVDAGRTGADAVPARSQGSGVDGLLVGAGATAAVAGLVLLRRRRALV
jgi:putative membrane protein